jgi:hypothetical protein
MDSHEVRFEMGNCLNNRPHVLDREGVCFSSAWP